MSWRLIGNVSGKVYCEAETKALCNAWKVKETANRHAFEGTDK